MGCDIHIWAEGKLPTHTITRLTSRDEPRIYNAFAFLAGVRNYADIKPLSEPRGIPQDCPANLRRYLLDSYFHSHSWFTLAELNSVDYDKLVENRRYTAQIAPGVTSGALTAPEGSGVMVPLRHLVTGEYINLFKRLARKGYDRIIFAFDN